MIKIESGIKKIFGFSIILIVLSATISGILYNSVKLEEEDKLHNEISNEKELFINTLQSDIVSILLPMQLISTQYRSNNSYIDFDKFNQFSNIILNQYDSLAGIGFILNITRSQIPEIEQLSQKIYNINTKINEINDNGVRVPVSTDREFYTPLFHVAPVETNIAALLFDIGSETSRLKTLHQSVELNKAVITEKLSLVQDVNDDPNISSFGFLAIHPVYEINTNNFIGYSSFVFRTSTIILNVLNKLSNSHISSVSVFDTTSLEKNEDSFLGGFSKRNNKWSKIPFNKIISNQNSLSVSFPNREWSVVITTDLITDNKQSIITLLSSLSLTVLSVIFIYVSLKQNIHSLKAAKESIEKLKTNNTEISHFMSYLCHELRNPIHIILSLIEISRNPSTAKELQEAEENNDIISRCATNMKTIINDVLNLEKLRSGKVVIQHKIFNIKNIVTDTIKYYSVMSHEHNNTINYKINENVPFTLIGDSIRIHQILSNIVSNACKFTNNGTVSIILNKLNTPPLPEEYVNRDDSSSISDTTIDLSKHVWLEIIVKDTGVGITESNLSKLFKPFLQVGEQDHLTLIQVDGETHGSPISNQQSSGLGLSLVKLLINQMNGCIVVDSKIGEGSSFKCIIPFLPAPENINNIRININEDDPLINPTIKILIADDELINLRILTKMMTNICKNYDIDLSIQRARNGQEVLDIYCNFMPDIIYCDIKMPVLNGNDAVTKLRKMGITIPIFAVSAMALIHDQNDSIDHGFTGFISKPFTNEDIEKSLIGCIQK
jgi:signal transduction histidine kinase/ActR/RegA family two-component response regulator